MNNGYGISIMTNNIDVSSNVRLIKFDYSKQENKLISYF